MSLIWFSTCTENKGSSTNAKNRCINVQKIPKSIQGTSAVWLPKKPKNIKFKTKAQ